ncbi:hypothetical protein BLNAU_16792 [Blattamonas nauphoetae]|uniref:RRM domain-containing protein n=1 Tax=Blattamonas nauphoetae TaxID=2049346 RepID=A0ABQ9X8L5_9EUKA|nr:hypothetical protein BLNAU_16792 [Blattamonas nauphoetae]
MFDRIDISTSVHRKTIQQDTEDSPLIIEWHNSNHGAEQIQKDDAKQIEFCGTLTLDAVRNDIFSTYMMMDARVVPFTKAVMNWVASFSLSNEMKATEQLSWVILSLHHLQTLSPPVLPNIQDDELLSGCLDEQIGAGDTKQNIEQRSSNHYLISSSVLCQTTSTQIIPTQNPSSSSPFLTSLIATLLASSSLALASPPVRLGNHVAAVKQIFERHAFPVQSCWHPQPTQWVLSFVSPSECILAVSALPSIWELGDSVEVGFRVGEDETVLIPRPDRLAFPLSPTHHYPIIPFSTTPDTPTVDDTDVVFGEDSQHTSGGSDESESESWSKESEQDEEEEEEKEEAEIPQPHPTTARNVKSVATQTQISSEELAQKMKPIPARSEPSNDLTTATNTQIRQLVLYHVPPTLTEKDVKALFGNVKPINCSLVENTTKTHWVITFTTVDLCNRAATQLDKLWELDPELSVGFRFDKERSVTIPRTSRPVQVQQEVKKDTQLHTDTDQSKASLAARPRPPPPPSPPPQPDLPRPQNLPHTPLNNISPSQLVLTGVPPSVTQKQLIDAFGRLTPLDCWMTKKEFDRATWVVSFSNAGQCREAASNMGGVWAIHPNVVVWQKVAGAIRTVDRPKNIPVSVIPQLDEFPSLSSDPSLVAIPQATLQVKEKKSSATPIQTPSNHSSPPVEQAQLIQKKEELNGMMKRLLSLFPKQTPTPAEGEIKEKNRLTTEPFLLPPGLVESTPHPSDQHSDAQPANTHRLSPAEGEIKEKNRLTTEPFLLPPGLAESTPHPSDQHSDAQPANTHRLSPAEGEIKEKNRLTTEPFLLPPGLVESTPHPSDQHSDAQPANTHRLSPAEGEIKEKNRLTTEPFLLPPGLVESTPHPSNQHSDAQPANTHSLSPAEGEMKTGRLSPTTQPTPPISGGWKQKALLVRQLSNSPPPPAQPIPPDPQSSIPSQSTPQSSEARRSIPPPPIPPPSEARRSIPSQSKSQSPETQQSITSKSTPQSSEARQSIPSQSKSQSPEAQRPLPPPPPCPASLRILSPLQLGLTGVPPDWKPDQLLSDFWDTAPVSCLKTPKSVGESAWIVTFLNRDLCLKAAGKLRRVWEIGPNVTIWRRQAKSIAVIPRPKEKPVTVIHQLVVQNLPPDRGKQSVQKAFAETKPLFIAPKKTASGLSFIVSFSSEAECDAAVEHLEAVWEIGEDVVVGRMKDEDSIVPIHRPASFVFKKPEKPPRPTQNTADTDSRPQPTAIEQKKQTDMDRMAAIKEVLEREISPAPPSHPPQSSQHHLPHSSSTPPPHEPPPRPPSSFTPPPSEPPPIIPQLSTVPTQSQPSSRPGSMTSPPPLISLLSTLLNTNQPQPRQLSMTPPPPTEPPPLRPPLTPPPPIAPPTQPRLTSLVASIPQIQSQMAPSTSDKPISPHNSFEEGLDRPPGLFSSQEMDTSIREPSHLPSSPSTQQQSLDSTPVLGSSQDIHITPNEPTPPTGSSPARTPDLFSKMSRHTSSSLPPLDIPPEHPSRLISSQELDFSNNQYSILPLEHTPAPESPNSDHPPAEPPPPLKEIELPTDPLPSQPQSQTDLPTSPQTPVDRSQELEPTVAKQPPTTSPSSPSHQSTMSALDFLSTTTPTSLTQFINTRPSLLLVRVPKSIGWGHVKAVFQNKEPLFLIQILDSNTDFRTWRAHFNSENDAKEARALIEKTRPKLGGVEVTIASKAKNKASLDTHPLSEHDLVHKYLRQMESSTLQSVFAQYEDARRPPMLETLASAHILHLLNVKQSSGDALLDLFLPLVPSATMFLVIPESKDGLVHERMIFHTPEELQQAKDLIKETKPIVDGVQITLASESMDAELLRTFPISDDYVASINSLFEQQQAGLETPSGEGEPSPQTDPSPSLSSSDASFSTLTHFINSMPSLLLTHVSQSIRKKQVRKIFHPVDPLYAIPFPDPNSDFVKWRVHFRSDQEALQAQSIVERNKPKLGRFSVQIASSADSKAFLQSHPLTEQQLLELQQNDDDSSIKFIPQEEHPTDNTNTSSPPLTSGVPIHPQVPPEREVVQIKTDMLVLMKSPFILFGKIPSGIRMSHVKDLFLPIVPLECIVVPEDHKCSTLRVFFKSIADKQQAKGMMEKLKLQLDAPLLEIVTESDGNPQIENDIKAFSKKLNFTSSPKD